MTALMGSDRPTLKLSTGSAAVSSVMSMRSTRVVSPGAKTRMPSMFWLKSVLDAVAVALL